MQKYTPNIAIVITTYKRPELLRKLLQSIRELKVGPAAIVVVDNDNSSETQAITKQFNVERYVAMEKNTGGAGGFSRGVAEAYRMGYEWFWLMDDDVAVLPNAIETLAQWTLKTDNDLASGVPISQTVGAFQPAKRNYDDTFFYWQYKFSTKFGMQNPLASAKRLKSQASTPMNCLCFEGGLVHRRAVEAAGLPDARFFIYADDTIYGYVLSQHTKMLFINDYTLVRTRMMQTMRVGSTRKLTPASDMSRYYIMRTRGHMANYLKLYGQYNPLFFGLGTAYTLTKELIRLFVSGSTADKRNSLHELRRGMRDANTIKHDTQWHPYSEVSPLPHTEPNA